MNLPFSIARRCSVLLLVLACLGVMTSVSSAQSPFTKSLKPTSYRVVVTPPKVVRFSNPAGSFGANEYTNPCFIAPAYSTVPTNWNQNELSQDDLWFWFE